MTEAIIEPWMRGIVPGINPVIGHLLRAAEHIREDVERATYRTSLSRTHVRILPEVRSA